MKFFIGNRFPISYLDENRNIDELSEVCFRFPRDKKSII